MNRATYPFKVMRITQNYNGSSKSSSHYLMSTGRPSDLPWDEGGADGGRDWVYCPVDEMKVARVYGVRSGGVNTIWLTSTDIVNFADGRTGTLTLMIQHGNDDDLSKIKAGQLFKRGDKICREGTDGTNANHSHLSCGLGTIKGNGWQKNSKGKFVLTTTAGPIKPEAVFFVDKAFTTIKSSNGLKFKMLPKTVSGVDGIVKVGDIVNFTGTKHYVSAFALTGKTCKPSKAKVTAISARGTHPYHLVAIGSGNVYGWVNKSDVEKE